MNMSECYSLHYEYGLQGFELWCKDDKELVRWEWERWEWERMGDGKPNGGYSEELMEDPSVTDSAA
jgi:hypothetical protein